MPALANNRHERFAQALAAGKSQQAAYVAAGYQAHESNPSKLAKDQRIVARVAELHSYRAEIEREGRERAIAATAIDKTWVIRRLIENVERASQVRPVTNADGETIGQFRYDGAVVNRALELLGKEMGMFINRQEVGKPGDFDRMSDEELDALIVEKSRALIGTRH